MRNLKKRNKIEMIILVLSINEEAKIKRILCFLNKTIKNGKLILNFFYQH